MLLARRKPKEGVEAPPVRFAALKGWGVEEGAEGIIESIETSPRDKTHAVDRQAREPAMLDSRTSRGIGERFTLMPEFERDCKA
jgi:hypothetical protein